MKTEGEIKVIGRIPEPEGPHDPRPTEARTLPIPEWAPQPNPMTREEIRKQVIDQIG
jgi:hypothetical protein